MADPRNPFEGRSVIPGPWKGTPFGEGGGGGLRPPSPTTQQPTPNRFQEIMKEMEAKFPAPKPQLEPAPSGATLPPTKGQGDPRLGGMTPKEWGKFTEGRPETSGAHPKDFMARREGQLKAEQEAQARRQEAETAAKMAAEVQMVQQRRAERLGHADKWLSSRGKPREVTPDFQREKAAEKKLGMDIAPPTKDYRGFIVETMERGSVRTNPKSGFAEFSTIEGGTAVRVPFKSRAEALEFAAKKPSLQDAKAKAELQRQRLGLGFGQDLPPQFIE